MRSIRQIEASDSRRRTSWRAEALRLGPGTAIAAGLLLAGLGGASGRAVARPSLVTLIDLSKVQNGPVIAACTPALSQLRDALDGAGIPTQRINAPTADALRLSLAQMGMRGGGPRMIVLCGYGASPAGQVFIAPADGLSGNADLSRSGVSADTFSRVAGPGSLTALDLHPLPGADLSDAAVSQWQAAAPPDTSRLASVAHGRDQVPLLAKLIVAAQGRGDSMLAAFLGVQPKPGRMAPEAPPPLPAAASGAGVAPPPAQKLAQKLVQKPAQKPVPDRPEPDAPVPPHPVGSASAPDSASAAQSKPVADAAAGKNDPVAATDTPHVAAAPASPVVTASVTPVRSHVKSGGRANPAATRRSPVQKADPQIRSVQLGLLAAGVYHGTVTGKDNAATTVAIQHYQEKLGHQPTGHLTPDEQKALTGG